MMETMFIGHLIIHFDSVDSTNTFAAQELQRERLVEGTVIRASHQSKGRGYAGNEWESEADKNLLVSVILYPAFLLPKNQFFLSQITALAIADVLEILIGSKEVKIKWPNDVFIGDKKVAGILIENSVQGNSIQQSIVGIGINVNQEKFDPSLKHATSILMESGVKSNIDEVMMNLFSQLEKRYLQLKQLRLDVLEKDYMKKLYLVNEMTSFSASGKKFLGKIVGLTADGKLLIEKDGVHEVFGFKEVEMVLD